MHRSGNLLRFVMNLFVAATMAALIFLPHTANAASPIYVRLDGDDVECTGEVDAAYPGGVGPLACAKRTIGVGITTVDVGGDVIIGPGTFNEVVSIFTNVTISGAGKTSTIVDGGGLDSVFSIYADVVSISDLTIQNGAANAGGGIFSNGNLVLTSVKIANNDALFDGGGIYHQSTTATLQISNSTFEFNDALGSTGSGGAILSFGPVELSGSTIDQNTAGAYGGGIIISGVDSQLTLTNSTVSGNSTSAANGSGGGIDSSQGSVSVVNGTITGNSTFGATSAGGGIASGGDLTLEDSLVADNDAAASGGGIIHYYGILNITDSSIKDNALSEPTSYAGGLYVGSSSTTTLNNVEISGNTAVDSAGGILVNGDFNATNVTISGNTGGYGAGIIVSASTPAILNNVTITENIVPTAFNAGGLIAYSTVNIENSIVAGNTNEECLDFGGSDIVSLGYNLDDDNTCGFSATGDMPSTSPLMGPLANHGGPTSTHALLAGSPAIDAGNNGSCPGVDQRGEARPVDGDQDATATCDIGAYERNAPVFNDVAWDYWARDYIEGIYNAGITSGCGGGNYCPVLAVSRAQMAKFLLVAEHGSGYTPPAGTGTMFGDVGPGHLFVDWIEQLANEGITSGCGGGNYCPDLPVSRAQMAKFLLIAEHGSGYTPPAGTGAMFLDVGPGHLFVDWIEQLASEGVTSGCGGGDYCPDYSVARDQMAVFLVRTFDLLIP